ncbi:MAG: radical SAM protein [Planctomycetes bacterium]|nr:radical SAM protein [Planctomycetota bacterium]
MKPPSQETPNGPRVFLETFGCQMNVLDSELVHGQLTALGYRFVDRPGSADVILYNTCSVREQAENKALSRVGRVGIRKREGRHVVLGVIGCMAEREGASLMSRYPQIDLMCGPGELDKLPMLLDNVMKAEAVAAADRVALQGSTSRRSTTLSAATDDLELLDLSRAFDPDRAEAGGRSAYVRITRGCNKFCTYCVVPNTRGPEVHRPPDAIVDECRRLADTGVIEITLLGQTVNHYRYTHGASITADGRDLPQVGPGAAAFRRINGGPRPPRNGAARVTTFADLLHRIHEEVPAVRRLRFVTSFPRDFGDDALSVMAESPRICRYLHVPAQSGSDRVLKRMNRGYTRGEYLEFVERARGFMPDVSIAGDFIVGFCGETDEDFELTRSLLREVRFKNNFIFKYSPRPGTAAHDRLADDVPEVVKRRRNNDLLALQAEISSEVHAAWVGGTVEVFVTGVGQRSAPPAGGGVELGWETGSAPEAVTQMTGRTDGDLITVFDLPDGRRPEDLVGTIVDVEVTASRPLLLIGDMRLRPESGGNAERSAEGVIHNAR